MNTFTALTVELIRYEAQRSGPEPRACDCTKSYDQSGLNTRVVMSRGAAKSPPFRPFIPGGKQQGLNIGLCQRDAGALVESPTAFPGALNKPHVRPRPDP